MDQASSTVPLKRTPPYTAWKIVVLDVYKWVSVPLGGHWNDASCVISVLQPSAQPLHQIPGNVASALDF